MTCIVGAIMYCSAVFLIRGDVGYGAAYTANEPWRYAVWYQPPTFPPTFPVIGLRRG